MKNRTRLISLLLTLVLMISAIPISAQAKGDVVYGVAWITGNNLRLRASASTSSKTLDKAPKGDVAVVISKKGSWYKVIYNNQTGYMSGAYLNVVTKENVELGYGRINANRVNLRSGAGTSYKAVATGSKGDKAYIIGINNGWYKIIYGTKICYIRSDYLDLTEIPYENADSDKSPKFFVNGKSNGVKVSASALEAAEAAEAAAKNKTSKSNAKKTTTNKTTTKKTTSTGDLIVETAKQYLDTPYVWAGASPSGFDCSGFVYYVCNSLGISVARTQEKMYEQGTPVDREDLKPGDIVFFQNTYRAGISHCGIYVGDGIFIHSSTSGDRVRYSELDSKYYAERYYGAVRYW